MADAPQRKGRSRPRKRGRRWGSRSADALNMAAAEVKAELARLRLSQNAVVRELGLRPKCQNAKMPSALNET